VEFIHDKATEILQVSAGICTPQIHVFLMQGARIYVARTGSATGVFRPDAQSQTHGKAKHFFPGLTIRFRTDHSFIDATRVSETLTSGDYQGQLHWNDN
jgi:hypothetical protein